MQPQFNPAFFGGGAGPWAVGRWAVAAAAAVETTGNRIRTGPSGPGLSSAMGRG